MVQRLWDRRELIAAAGLSAMVLPLSACQTAAVASASDGSGHPLLVRPRWSNELDAVHKQKFHTAVAWFKANDQGRFPNSDPRSYLTWKKLASAHALSCQHMTHLFLPWHRLYLSYFEAACRYALRDASFVLPYWDWTLDSQLPAEFSSSAFPHFKVLRALHAQAQIPAEFVGKSAIERILAIDDFYAFHSGPAPSIFHNSQMMAGHLEGTCHNAVHNTIGGPMLRLAAPEDPIFWLHHANIDRLWSAWSRRHPQAMVPSEKPADWLATSLKLTFLDPSAPGKSRVLPDIPRTEFNAAIAGNCLVKDVLTAAAAQYTYDDLLKAGPEAAKPTPFTGRNEYLVDGMARVEKSVLISAITLNPELTQKLQNIGGGHVSLLALNVPVLPDPAISNRLIIRFFAFEAGEVSHEYLNSVRTQVAMQRPDYLGSYTFLAQGHLTHEQVSKGTVNLNLDITAWILSNQSQNLGKFTVLAVVLDPAKQNSIVNLFEDVETEIKLQFAAS
ncbi:MAG: tyrosinase family protein [Chitinophagaceae bacterium]|nr:tyrosinase family protein [Oligoflexus sp.]